MYKLLSMGGNSYLEHLENLAIVAYTNIYMFNVVLCRIVYKMSSPLDEYYFVKKEVKFFKVNTINRKRYRTFDMRKKNHIV